MKRVKVFFHHTYLRAKLNLMRGTLSFLTWILKKLTMVSIVVMCVLFTCPEAYWTSCIDDTPLPFSKCLVCAEYWAHDEIDTPYWEYSCRLAIYEYDRFVDMRSGEVLEHVHYWEYLKECPIIPGNSEA